MQGPIRPATIVWRDDGTPWSPEFGDVYHPAQGALQQAEQVFLRGNGLPGRWQGRSDFVVLETGFGLGHNFLATWQAWRADPGRSTRLHYLAVEAHPPALADLRRAHAASPLRDLGEALQAQWPPPTADLHRLDFDGGRVRLSLAFGDVRATLRALQAQVDAAFLDGFAPRVNEAMWTEAVFQRLARLCRPGATAATWSAARAVRDGLARAGFQVERAEGPPGKRDITVARFAPRHRAPPPAAWAAQRADEGAPKPAVLIIGAGLAGCAAARALAQLGWPSRVLDAAEGPACGASSNDAGLFHASFSAPDAMHARWHRSAAARMQAWAAPAVAAGLVRGQTAGLLQVHAGLGDDQAQAQMQRAGLTPDVVRWLSADEARRHTGLAALPGGGWWYAQGGWLAPRDVAGAWLDEARRASAVDTTFGARVATLRRRAGRWQALAADGSVLAEAGLVVLATALDALRLLGGLAVDGQPLAPPTLPFEATRGQVTRLAAQTGVNAPRVPVAGAGYAIGLDDGGLLCGSTREPLPSGPAPEAIAVTWAGHQANLRQAAALGAVDATWAAPWLAGDAERGTLPLSGRAGVRLAAIDRLPWVGPLPDRAAAEAARTAGARLDALRHLPRLQGPDHGLYLMTALGSRGLTSAALAGELLAHWITQTPCPVPAPLCDALDPARHALRQWQRANVAGVTPGSGAEA